GEDEDIAANEVAAAQAGDVYLRWDRAGIEYERAPQRFHGYTTIATRGISLSLVTLQSTRSSFGGTVGGAFSNSRGVTSSRFMSLGGREPPRGSRSCFMRYGRRGRRMDGFLRTSLIDWLSFGAEKTSRGCSGPTRRTEPPRPVDRRALADPPPTSPLERGCEVFEWTHTRKKDRSWVDRCSHDCKEAFKEEKNRFEAERQAIIDTGGPESPPIDDEAIWLRISGGRQKGRIYGKGVVLVYSVALIIEDVDDDDTASGPPDVREQVTLLNRELSKQAEANCQRVVQDGAICEEKVRTLETALESQSQVVSQLRKAYSDMYNFLEQMRSGGSGSAAFTAMPPPPPPLPPARFSSPPPQTNRATSPSQHDDDPDYV
ncbi:hypothetical protein PIB30_097121, partial [Stylosanthes scabra]|nr:hypothetical protein [Stylosanthes scabra]